MSKNSQSAYPQMFNPPQGQQRQQDGQHSGHYPAVNVQPNVQEPLWSAPPPTLNSDYRHGASADPHTQLSTAQSSGPSANPNTTTNDAKGPMDKIMSELTSLGKKAEVVATSVWSHLKTGPSVADSALGRLSLGTRVLTEGGLEKVFKATFPADPNEHLKKTYACFLSTSTGPVAGTLYISTVKIGFCSDRAISYSPGPGQQAWSFYKVVVPLNRLKDVLPSVNEDKPLEKYIQLTTVDNFEFWFMGFVNYDKGLNNLKEAARSGRCTMPGPLPIGNPGGPSHHTGYEQWSYVPNEDVGHGYPTNKK